MPVGVARRRHMVSSGGEGTCFPVCCAKEERKGCSFPLLPSDDAKDLVSFLRGENSWLWSVVISIRDTLAKSEQALQDFKIEAIAAVDAGDVAAVRGILKSSTMPQFDGLLHGVLADRGGFGGSAPGSGRKPKDRVGSGVPDRLMLASSPLTNDAVPSKVGPRGEGRKPSQSVCQSVHEMLRSSALPAALPKTSTVSFAMPIGDDAPCCEDVNEDFMGVDDGDSWRGGCLAMQPRAHTTDPALLSRTLDDMGPLDSFRRSATHATFREETAVSAEQAAAAQNQRNARQKSEMMAKNYSYMMLAQAFEHNVTTVSDSTWSSSQGRRPSFLKFDEDDDNKR